MKTTNFIYLSIDPSYLNQIKNFIIKFERDGDNEGKEIFAIEGHSTTLNAIKSDPKFRELEFDPFSPRLAFICAGFSIYFILNNKTALSKIIFHIFKL